MSHDDVLFRYRLRLFTLAEELGSVSEACRRMGVSRQTYYRLKRQVDRWGLEALRVRERRRPRQPNEIGPHLEQRIVAFSLAHPVEIRDALRLQIDQRNLHLSCHLLHRLRMSRQVRMNLPIPPEISPGQRRA